MSGKEGKRSKGRRNLYSQSKSSVSSSSCSTATGGSTPAAGASPFQPFGSGVAKNVCDVATEFSLNLKSSPGDEERITELMDAPVDIDIPPHAISRGPNPYLDRCMYCNTPRTESHDGDDGTELLDLQLDGNTVISGIANPQSFSSFKLEIWTCPTCRKVAGNFQTFLEANQPQAAYDSTFLQDKAAYVDPLLACVRWEEERDAFDKETQALQEYWVELRSIVKELYVSVEEPSLSSEKGSTEKGERLRLLVDTLCNRDPHQLFLRLESQVREVVTDIKNSLVKQLTEDGCDTPELALAFTSTMLSQYEKLTKRAHILAQHMGGLSDHLRQFKVTWELLNKHLFHSIAHNDPAISSSGPTILEQLRQGSMQNERSREDPYCSVRKSLLKFQEEMSVVVVVWRDCQQLIQNYCHEEVKNTQKQVTSKARSFITQQRQFLKDHLMKEPLMDEALSETMRNLMSGHKSSTDRVLCHRCNRERCTCDECTITHMITCGIINSDSPNSFNFAVDPARNVMDIRPPSMSSTTSSSGSVSPINMEDKRTAFFDCGEDINDTLLHCNGGECETSGYNSIMNNDDIDENAGDDEEEDDDDIDYDDVDNQDAGSDEPHALQLPACELKDDAVLWEAVQHQQLLQQQQQQLFSGIHSCAHCPSSKHDNSQCEFQPRIDSELSKQLEAEIANSGFLQGGASNCVGDSLVSAGDNLTNGGSGDAATVINPGMCATCQCHACLKQSGHIISTSLPLQVPVSPPPAELHLYPHIHGLSQHHSQRYMFNLPTALVPPPLKPDLEDPENHYHAHSDWDNSMQPRAGSLAAQHHQRLSGLNTELLPPAPLTSMGVGPPPFTFDSLLTSHLATHTTQTSTTNTTSAFKSVTGKNLTSSLLPNINMGGVLSEGSSVDPTKPLDFASLVKIPQSCLNAPASAPSSFSSSAVSSSAPSLSTATTFPSLPVSLSPSAKTGNGTCHSSSCSRPTPVGGNSPTSKWERTHPQMCKKFGAAGLGRGLLNKGTQHHAHNVHSFTGAPQANPPSPVPMKSHHHNGREDASKSFRNPLPCSHSSAPTSSRTLSNPQVHPASPSSIMAPSSTAGGGGTSALPVDLALPVANTNASTLSAVVNNIGVGASAPCTDPECGVHHQEDNCDSVDDSCSEKSSSTSTSNQKEGKYCDCCYCEFFGHNNPQVAKTSTNYAEMKDRLRKKLKKRQSENKHKTFTPKNGLVQPEECEDDQKDPIEKKGLEGLLSFINGTDEAAQNKYKENKELTAKAAKRARQKQRKLEEKARQEKSSSPSENHRVNSFDRCQVYEPEKALRNLLKSQSLCHPHNLDHENMGKPRSKKPQAGKKDKNEQDLHNFLDLLPKQEASRNLIIESTRPTISITAKDLDKLSQKRMQAAPSNSKETSKQMIQVLDILQSLKHQQQSQQSVPPMQPSVQRKAPQPQNIVQSVHVKTNGTLESAPKSAGSEKEVMSEKQQPQRSNHSQQQQQQQSRVNQSQSKQQTTSGLTNSGQNLKQRQPQKPQTQKIQLPTQQQQQSKTQQPQVTVPTKCMNGKVSSVSIPPSSTSSNHAMTNGKSGAAEKRASTQHPVTNGSGLPKGISGVSSANSSSNGTTVTSKPASVPDSPSAGSGSSTSQSPSCGSKASTEQVKTKSKKNKKKSRNGDISLVDEIFMPKPAAELEGDVDDFERELEEFKRFCFEPAEPKEKRKIAVNVNLKDIFKKKPGLVSSNT